MRVDVDEARRHDMAVGVDRLRGVLVDVTDRDDAARAYADVGASPGCPRAVDDLAAPDQQVEHLAPLAHDGALHAI